MLILIASNHNNNTFLYRVWSKLDCNTLVLEGTEEGEASTQDSSNVSNKIEENDRGTDENNKKANKNYNANNNNNINNTRNTYNNLNDKKIVLNKMTSDSLVDQWKNKAAPNVGGQCFYIF